MNFLCRPNQTVALVCVVALAVLPAGCASGSVSNGGGGSSSGRNVQPPATLTALQATAGNAQVTLSWTARTGTTTYNVKRSTMTAGPYTTISSPATTSFTDTGLTNGTPYFFAVECGLLVPVAARNTSRRCPESVGGCGHVSAENRQTQAKFVCVQCGFSANADWVAAVNVKEDGLASLACLESSPMGASCQEPTEGIPA